MTTKNCPICGNTNLVHLTTSDKKVCTDHREFVIIDWKLSEGQAPIFDETGKENDK